MSEQASTERPAADSANGRLNGYLHHCPVVEHSMYYVACLARIDAVTTKGARVPQDWVDCAGACKTRTCQAQKMREEELTKGQAIYFLERGVVQVIAQKTRAWIDTWNAAAKKGVAVFVKPVSKKSASALDAMAEASKISLADALNAAAADEVAKQPSPSAKSGLIALPFETPLQMARRLAAQRHNPNKD